MSFDRYSVSSRTPEDDAAFSLSVLLLWPCGCSEPSQGCDSALFTLLSAFAASTTGATDSSSGPSDRWRGARRIVVPDGVRSSPST